MSSIARAGEGWDNFGKSTKPAPVADTLEINFRRVIFLRMIFSTVVFWGTYQLLYHLLK